MTPNRGQGLFRIIFQREGTRGIFYDAIKTPVFVLNLTKSTLIQLNLGLIQVNLAKSSCKSRKLPKNYEKSPKFEGKIPENPKFLSTLTNYN